MKKIKLGLLPRVIIAIALGIALGNVLSLPVVRVFVTFNAVVPVVRSDHPLRPLPPESRR